MADTSNYFTMFPPTCIQIYGDLYGVCIMHNDTCISLPLLKIQLGDLHLAIGHSQLVGFALDNENSRRRSCKPRYCLTATPHWRLHSCSQFSSFWRKKLSYLGVSWWQDYLQWYSDSTMVFVLLNILPYQWQCLHAHDKITVRLNNSIVFCDSYIDWSVIVYTTLICWNFQVI